SPDSKQKYVISGLSPSDDGTKIAIEVAPSGSESSILLIMNVQEKTFYSEKIDRCWFASPSWLPSGDAFLFNRLQSSDVHDTDREKDSKTYLHIVGTDPATDREIFSRAKYPELGIKPEYFPMVSYDKDSQYLFGFVLSVDRRLHVFYAPTTEINKERINWKELIKEEDEIYNFSATKTELYLYTPKDAPHFKLLKTSLKAPDLANAEVVVAENPQEILRSFALTNEGIYYTLSQNGVTEKLYRLPYGTNKARELHLPFAAGSASLRTKGFKYSDVWAVLSGWTSDYQRYRYLVQDDDFKLEPLSATAEYPEYTDLQVEELMVPSHDGVKVPLSLIYKKGLKKDGKNPVLFLGYGAYGSSIHPFFSPNFLLWTQEGGILAIAHVRGGGELGEQWYKGGFKTTKPNTWKDLISCADYVIQKQYSSSQKIAITGGSAGGILIGRAMTERPDLFAVAIPKVGCLNPLRAEESPNGPVNIPEFGTVKDSNECMALIEMDAYLHLEDGANYPATLVTAGMNDPRVIAWQPAKFAARLQAASTSNKPVLFRVDYDAGHGIGNTKTKQFASLADVLSFALWQMGHPKYQRK
ncbi:MAG: S9 family peptidase, partial [Candidatus Electrothrix sp. AUS4]|nr:S9 family peptidase [Candidatus Electrothrix sp. AUS4]